MDQGGTFTDVVRVTDDGHLKIEKVLTDNADLTALAEGASQIRRGTTVATNALLERTCPPVLLITNAGFGDIPWLSDGRRPHLFSLNIQRPEPLCTAVMEVGGRIDADGHVVAPLSIDLDALRAHRESGISAVAVVLIHGPLHPATENQAAERCAEAGFTTISVGHKVAPSRGFLSRLQTTLADAALSPLLPRTPGLYMRSDGGLSTAEEWSGAQAILSGPAGGVVATAAIAKAAGVNAAFGLDMGGTSTDVCRFEHTIERADHLEISGLKLRVPCMAIETIAAGGGSVLACNDGVMTVGPRSAGSKPGPASYGRQGPATLTDAEAVLGRLPDFPHVCGPHNDQSLDLDAARTAIDGLSTGLSTEEAAQGFKMVAAETAARAVRSLAAARGVDPSEHALIAFGGAGPGHACAIARALGIQTVIVPHNAGVLSAVGIGLSSRRAERVAPIHGSISNAVQKVKQDPPFDGSLHLRLACRHTGTDHNLEIDIDPNSEPVDELTDEMRAAFHAGHQERFGFSRPELEIEAVEVRLAIEEPSQTLNWTVPPATSNPRQTRAWFSEWTDVPWLEMHHADGIVGPAILNGPGCTVTVDRGWRVSVEPSHITLTDTGESPAKVGTSFHPIHTAIFATRAMAIAEQMGERLGRLARSISIRERKDFSCAIFDTEGQLVANAPHVPVHLGAMGETVRDLIVRRSEQLQPGTTWASNDPYAGGSHLPDITVMRPVYRAGERVAFVACRGHHVDVGGITPGSMPPNSTHIEEEGLRLRCIQIANADGFHCPPMHGCRQPDELRADLLAQVAAVSMGEGAVQRLIDAISLPSFRAQMTHLMAGAARAVARVLQTRNGEHQGKETLDDGTELSVSLTIDGDRGAVLLDGPAHPGNLNAPTAVAKAALLYVLRCLVNEPNQLLNAGSLHPVTLSLNPGGIFDPQEPAAVAGGNVETSQRLVDALLTALGAQAASQGTMNNLTVGTRSGVWYETIPGGSGAGPNFEGAHGVQVHMTNTRSTDVEELERRFAVRLIRMERREGSGGPGAHTGGDGIIKEWLFLDHAEVSLLAERRAAGAPGANGGRPGLPGVDEINTGAGWEPMPKRWTASHGDRLRILTPGGGGFGSTD